MIARLGKLFAIGAGAGVAFTAALLSPNDNVINSCGPARFGRAAATMVWIASDYKLNIYLADLPKDPDEANKIWSEVHKRSAEKLLALCGRNKGLFVKVGQHIGAMDYLLPKEYTHTLRILHNQAPSSSIEEVCSVIEYDLHKKKDEIFEEFADTPIGTASLAQVYRAKLKTGDIVAVKVQHPMVRAHSYVDIATMEVLVHFAAWIFPDFKLLWLGEEMKKNLPKELDFLQEGENGEKMSALMKGYKWLKIPKIYWELSSHRVLVMEFCEGGLINDIDYMKRHNISPHEVASKLGDLFSEMIFVHGHLHSDPHPGNILVRKDELGKLQLCLLDHGLYARLPDDLRYNYSNLWLSIIAADADGIKEASKALGVGNLYVLFASMITARSWNSISSGGGITKMKLSKAENIEIREKISSFIVEISEVIDSLPRPMIMVLKTNDLLRSVEHSLGIQKTMTSFLTMSKHCIHAVYNERIRVCQTGFCRFNLGYRDDH